MDKLKLSRAKYAEYKEYSDLIKNWWNDTCMLLNYSSDVSIDDLQLYKNKFDEELEEIANQISNELGISFDFIEVYNAMIDRFCDIEFQLYELSHRDEKTPSHSCRDCVR